MDGKLMSGLIFLLMMGISFADVPVFSIDIPATNNSYLGVNNGSVTVTTSESSTHFNHTAISLIDYFSGSVVYSVNVTTQGTIQTNLTVPYSGRFNISATAYDNPLTDNRTANATNITMYGCGAPMASSGTYLLQADSWGSGTCLQANSNQVVLDCGGHVLNTTGAGVYVTNGMRDFLVRNCVIYAQNGIYWTNGRLGYDDYPLGNRNMTAYNNTITVTTENGIIDYNSRENHNITSNRIYVTTGNGLYLYIVNSGASVSISNNNYSVITTGVGIRAYWSISGYANFTSENIQAPLGTGIYLQQFAGGSNLKMESMIINASVGINSYNNGGHILNHSKIYATANGIFLNNNGGPNIDNSEIIMSGTGNGYYCGANTANGLSFNHGNISTDSGYCLVPQSGYSCSQGTFANVNFTTLAQTCIKDTDHSTFTNDKIVYGGSYGFNLKSASYGNSLTNVSINCSGTSGTDYNTGADTVAPTFSNVTLNASSFSMTIDNNRAFNFTRANVPAVDPERYSQGKYISLTMQAGTTANVTMLYTGSPPNEIDFRLFDFNGTAWIETYNSSTNTTSKQTRGTANTTYGNSGIYAILGSYNPNVTNIFLSYPPNNLELCGTNLTYMMLYYLTPNFTTALCGWYFPDLSESPAYALFAGHYENLTVNFTHAMNIEIPEGSHSLVAFCANIYPDNSTFLIETTPITVSSRLNCAVNTTLDAFNMFFSTASIILFLVAICVIALAFYIGYIGAGEMGSAIAGIIVTLMVSFIPNPPFVPIWVSIVAVIAGILAAAYASKKVSVE